MLNFHLFFFAKDLVENFDEVRSFWNISSCEDSDDEQFSISDSSDESSSLSLSHSSVDKLYFLFLDPLSLFLGEFYLSFWPSLFFDSTLFCDTCYLKFYQVAGFLMDLRQLK